MNYPTSEHEARTIVDRVEAVLASHRCPARAASWTLDAERKRIEIYVPAHLPDVAVPIGRALGAPHCRIKSIRDKGEISGHAGIVVVGWGPPIVDGRDLLLWKDIQWPKP